MTAQQIHRLPRSGWLAALLLAVGLSGCGETTPPAETSAAPAAAEASSEPADTAADWPHGESTIDPGYAGTPEGMAPLLDGIGPVDFPVTTEVEQARAYFNQALTFSYGFNHAEAERSFREAADWIRAAAPAGGAWRW